MSYHRTTMTTYLCWKQAVAQLVPEQYWKGSWLTQPTENELGQAQPLLHLVDASEIQISLRVEGECYWSRPEGPARSGSQS
jgi:hypothetical protein